MKRFASLLREIDRKLDLPQPARSQVVLEVAGDLRDAYDHYRETGLGADEAEKRAAATFDLSDQAIAELGRIHRSAMQRMFDRISEQSRARWERFVLVALILFVATFSGREMLTRQFFALASPFIWPILGVTVASVALAVVRSYGLFLRQDHRGKRLRAGLEPLLRLAGGVLLIGAYGFLYEGHRSVRIFEAVPDPELLWPIVIDWLFRIIPMLTAGLLSAIGIGLIWFVLAARAARIERAELEILFGK